jgi:hypothetical protein
MNGWVKAAAALAAITAAGSTAWAQASGDNPRTVQFSLPGADISFPLPDGYCVPTGQYQAAASVTAAGDATNATDVSFDSCSEMSAGGELSHYGMVKTPKENLVQTANRADLVAEFKGMMGDGSMKKILEDPGIAQAADKDVGKVLGQSFKSKTSIQPVDVDADAAYMAGTLVITLDKETHVQAVGVGVTVIKGKVILYYFYAPYSGLQDVAAVLKTAKTETARFIRQNEP